MWTGAERFSEISRRAIIHVRQFNPLSCVLISTLLLTYTNTKHPEHASYFASCLV